MIEMLLEMLILLLSIVIIYLWFKNREWSLRFEQRLKSFIEEEEERIRQDAILRSARTLSGKTLEKFVPFLSEFKYNPHDVRWLGDPVDFIIFDGYSTGKPRQIVFCEVKSGKSSLSKNQREIRDLIRKRKIKWDEFRIEK